MPVYVYSLCQALDLQLDVVPFVHQLARQASSASSRVASADELRNMTTLKLEAWDSRRYLPWLYLLWLYLLCT